MCFVSVVCGPGIKTISALTPLTVDFTEYCIPLFIIHSITALGEYFKCVVVSKTQIVTFMRIVFWSSRSPNIFPV